MVEVAVVGIGGWGKNLARNYAQIPEANLRYVCDLDQAKLDQAARQYPGSQLTRKFEDLLEDPELLFGSDNVVPLVREDVASSVQAPLDAVSAKLDTPALADMVKQVVVDKKDASVVAKDWLTSAGLV